MAMWPNVFDMHSMNVPATCGCVDTDEALIPHLC
jgi:hypothetical protein